MITKRNQFFTSISTGYQTAYSQLAFAGKKEHDMLPESVPQLKLGLAKQLEKLGAMHPGKVREECLKFRLDIKAGQLMKPPCFTHKQLIPRLSVLTVKT